MELSDVMFRRTKHFLLLLGLCKHLANLFLCAIKHIYTKKQRTCDGISWLQFFLEKWGYLDRRLKELPGYKSKAFPCDKGRVNTLPTTSFVLSGIMVQLLLEKQGYLAKRRKKSPSKRCWAVIHTGFEMAKMVWLQHWFWHMPFRKMQGMEHKLSCRSYVLRRLWNWASGHCVGGIPREKHLQFLQCIQGLLKLVGLQHFI